MRWIEGQSGKVATSDTSALLLALLSVVMTALAERLPVARIPEQSLVTTMRDDVVNHRCHYNVATLFVVSTQRMVRQKCGSRLLPPATVTALRRCLAILIGHKKTPLRWTDGV